VGPPPEGKRRGLRRFGRGRKKAEAEPASQELQASAVAADEPAEAEAAAAESEPPTEEDELAARFDAARERLRATIKPPPPDDG
jgi:hypothetical protein